MLAPPESAAMRKPVLLVLLVPESDVIDALLNGAQAPLFNEIQ